MKKQNIFFTFLLSLGTLLSAYSQSLPSYVPTTGLTGYWSFTGNANDNSGNTNNGTVSGATLTSDRFGKANNAYSFNGTTDKITFPQLFQFHQSGDATLSIWINANDQSGGPQGTVLFSKTSTPDANRFNFYVYHTTVVNASLDYRTPSGSLRQLITNTQITKNAWRHFVYVRSGNVYTLYLDGQFKSSYTDNSPLLPNSTGWMVGQDPTTTSDFTGQIDDIGIWARALSQSEISALFNSINTGADNMNNKAVFSIYPNPAGNQVTVQYEESLNGSPFIITDQLGRSVICGKLNMESNTINLDNLPSGIYILRLMENSSQPVKIIKN